MRRLLTAAFVSLGFLALPAYAQISFHFGGPGVNVGINLGAYPQLVAVPGEPVYYAPSVNGNYFYYDGLYWVFANDNWYESSWYNGPWQLVDPMEVPTYVLQVPVRYYHRPPAYFHGWAVNSAPRWDQHWGNSWTERRQGWDRRDEHAARAPAPLPQYQQRYSGNRYPQGHEQSVIHAQNNHYQPQENISRQHFEYHRNEAAHPQAQAQPQQREAPYRTPTTPKGQERNGGTGDNQRG
jgi:hypothetical protein